MGDNVEIIRSNKGGMKIIHRGYMYTVHKKRQGGGIRWRCTQRSLHCKGSISTGNGLPTVNMPHNHIPDPHSVALARCRQLEEFPDVTSLLETEYDDIRDSSLVRTSWSNARAPMSASNAASSAEFQNRPSTRQFGGGSSKRQMATPKVIEDDPPAEEVCLRWNSHHSNMQAVFPRLLEKEQYVDVTVTAEGKTLKCHRMILSSCSSYFEEILGGIAPSQHPVVILKGVPFWTLKLLIDFMYVGEISIDQSKLPQLLDVADMLKIKGLTGKNANNNDNDGCVREEANQGRTVKGSLPSDSGVPAGVAIGSGLQPVSASDPRKGSKRQGEVSSTRGVISKTKQLKSSVKKVYGKRFRKKKSMVEHEKTPPIFPMRRGTRSRPNVKVPRCYDYEDIVKPSLVTEVRSSSPTVTIKTEPIDIEENDISFDEDHSEDSKEIHGIDVRTLETLRKITDLTPPPSADKNQLVNNSAVAYKIKIKRPTDLCSSNEGPSKTNIPFPNADAFRVGSVKSIVSKTAFKNEVYIDAVDILMEQDNTVSELGKEQSDDDMMEIQ